MSEVIRTTTTRTSAADAASGTTGTVGRSGMAMARWAGMGRENHAGAGLVKRGAPGKGGRVNLGGVRGPAGKVARPAHPR